MKGNCRESPCKLILNTQFTKRNLKIRISALSKKYGYECRFIFYKCYLLCYTKCAY